jgi:tRNA uridine 5-carbamoylmethylation protein Kti12
MLYAGGPCAGKTTAFSAIKKYLTEHDYRVYMVPEAATLLFINGVAFDDLNYPERQYAMQQSVLK